MLSLLWLLACDSITVEKTEHHSDTAVDADGDGFITVEDCDDMDSSIHPGADEVAGDKKDSNCDGYDDT